MSRRTRARSAGMLLLSVLVAALVASPALAVGSRLHVSGMLRDAAGVAMADHTAKSGPAAAVVHRPDGSIRLAVGTASGHPAPYVGNNVYNTTGAHQTSRANYYGTSFPGDLYTFDISIQNDGTRADRFKVKATGTATTGWKVQYFHGATNVTSRVVAGTYRTSSLVPSATYLIKANVTLVSLSAGPTRLVTITSAADATRKDAVKFVFKLATCGC